MANIQLKLYQTNPTDGTNTTTSITNVNPEASNSVLLAFAQKIQELTDRTYTRTDKVTTINLDTDEEAQDTRPTPTLRLIEQSSDKEITSVSQSQFQTTTYDITFGRITYTGDGKLYAVSPSLGGNYVAIGFSQNTSTGYFHTWGLKKENLTANVTITICATETENYKAPEPVTITVTA